MIYIERKQAVLYKELLTNIDSYDIVYVVDMERQNGEMISLDDYTIFYINPKQIAQFEVVFEILENEIRADKTKSIAIIHVEHLLQKTIRYIRGLPIQTDLYSLFSDFGGNIYPSAKYLYDIKIKEDKHE